MNIENKLKSVAILVSSLEVAQSMLRVWQTASYNDSAMKVSSWMDLVASGFYVASAIQQATKTVAKETGAFGAKLVEDQAGRTLAVNSTEILGRVVGRTVLAFIPIFDVLSLIAFAFEIGSWISALFKDNLYENWAKGSQFAKD